MTSRNSNGARRNCGTCVGKGYFWKRNERRTEKSGETKYDKFQCDCKDAKHMTREQMNTQMMVRNARIKSSEFKADDLVNGGSDE